jgi:hypothetical protein
LAELTFIFEGVCLHQIRYSELWMGLHRP